MSTKLISLPRGDEGNFRFQVELEGAVFTLLFQFNRRADVWYLDVLQEDGTPIRRSIKVTVDYFWLRQVKRTPRPNGDLFALDTTLSGLRATFDELDEQIQIIYEESPVP